jgi:hypothetical protein
MATHWVAAEAIVEVGPDQLLKPRAAQPEGQGSQCRRDDLRGRLHHVALASLFMMDLLSGGCALR